MRYKQFKKQIKFYLAISFIISLFIMLRVAIKQGNLMCGLYYKPSPCPIFPWLIQVLVFTIGVAIIFALLITAVKTVLKYVPEIKKLKLPKSKKEIKAVKKTTSPAASKKEEGIAGKKEKPKKKEGIIRI